MEPEFRPYGLPHLTVIFLTIVLPFVLAAIVWRTKSRLLVKMIIGVLSAALILNYVVYLVFFRRRRIGELGDVVLISMGVWGVVGSMVASWCENDVVVVVI